MLDEPGKRSLVFATPMFGGMCTAKFARSAMHLATACAHLEIPFACSFRVNESLVQRARNLLCNEFLRSNGTHLLFIDADIGFTAQDSYTFGGQQESRL